MANQRFNKSYFDRYYGKRPVRSLHEVAHLATAVHELAPWWNSPIRSVLEVGAGPKVRVMSVDVSEHACATYGHQQRDIATWSPAKPFDLVICMDVLQYLDDTHATRALRNLTKATRTLLYFDALTSFDAEYTVDRAATDLNAHLRTGDWYRRRLSRSFTQVGVGLWVRKNSPVVLHELERAQ